MKITGKMIMQIAETIFILGGLIGIVITYGIYLALFIFFVLWGNNITISNNYMKKPKL